MFRLPSSLSPFPGGMSKPFAAARQPSFGGEPLGKQLKVMSYNVGGLQDQDKLTIARNIKEADPAIVLLQECGTPSQLKSFNRRPQYLDNRYHTIVGPTSVEAGKKNIAILLKQKVRLLETKSHCRRLDRSREGGSAPALQEATFIMPEDGFVGTVFNIHAKSMVGSNLRDLWDEAEGLSPEELAQATLEAARQDARRTQPARLRETEDISAIIQQRLQANPGVPTFALGDLNSVPDTDEGQAILDIFASGANEPMTELTMQAGEIIPTRPARHFLPAQKLDYALANPKGSNLVESIEVIDDPAPGCAHNPILMTLRKPVRSRNKKSPRFDRKG